MPRVEVFGSTKDVLVARDRVQTEAFESGYPFGAEFCVPAKGWERGSVETRVKCVRNLVFPAPAGGRALDRVVFSSPQTRRSRFRRASRPDRQYRSGGQPPSPSNRNDAGALS